MIRALHGVIKGGGGASTLLDGLVSQWKLNNSTVDDKGGFNLTVDGGMGYTTGKVSDCFSADGINDKAYNTNGYNLSSDGTISFSLNPNSAQPSYALMLGSRGYNSANANNWNFQLESPTQLRVVLATGTASYAIGTYAGVITSSVWQQVLIQINSSTQICSVYIDNVLVTSGSGEFATGGRTFADLVNGIEFFMSQGVGTHLKGEIDCVKIWNRLLTTGEKTENYNNGNDIEL